MEEYSRLGNLGFLQLIVGSGEHDISNIEAENLVGLIDKFFCQCVVIVEVLTHTYELSRDDWSRRPWEDDVDSGDNESIVGEGRGIVCRLCEH